MPQITAISPQKKKERFNIFINDKFALSANLETILNYNLKVGTLISEAKIQEISSGERLFKLTDLATNYLSYRPRSVKEVQNYLAAKIAKLEGIKFGQAKESPQISSIIAKLKRYNLLDDREFAAWFVKSRIKSQPKSPTYIKMELRAKGIDQDIIEKVLAGPYSEVKLAKRAIVKKLKIWQKLSPLDFKKKLYSYLASRGFSYETIKVVFANLAKNR